MNLQSPTNIIISSYQYADCFCMEIKVPSGTVVVTHLFVKKILIKKT